MNAQKIYQKRIEEAASHYLLHEHKSPLNEILHQCDLKTEMQYHRDIEQAYIEGGKNSLQNQWISVNEALPPKEDNDSSITVLVHCQKGWCGIDYYRYKYGEWLNNGNSVTHWMYIPTINNEEK